MEYSLQHLNKKANLKDLTLANFVETLDLIGLEVDDIIFEKLPSKSNLNDIKLDIKIPANREDLLNDTILIDEFATIFLFHVYKTWEELKSSYFFLLTQKYSEYSNYSVTPIVSDIPGIVTYGITLESFKEKQLPIWLKKKLPGDVEKNIIEALIDLVVLEWGQNFNTLDSNLTNLKLERLKDEQNFLFNNEKYLLKKGSIILKSKGNDIISVLGIINKSFKNNKIFIEATFYDIDKNILDLNDVNTKVSFRYLRRTFLTSFKFSFQRLLSLIEIIAEGKISSNISKNIPENTEITFSRLLKIDKNSCKQYLNIDEYDLKIFEKSNLKIVCSTLNSLYFRIPDSRKDLVREIDLIEEYARFIGYKNFKEISPIILPFTVLNNKNRKIEFIKQFFINANFNEVFTNSLESETESTTKSIFLTNPLNSDLAILRSSLISNLIEIYTKNLRFSADGLNFFEIGRVYKKENNKIFEEEHLALIFPLEFIKTSDSKLDFFKAKSFIQQFLRNFSNKSFIFKKEEEQNESYHPKKSLKIYSEDKIIGTFGEIHPKYKKLFSLKQNIYLFEFNLDSIKTKNLKSQIKTYKEYSKYPLITKDLSIIISTQTNFCELKQFIKNSLHYLKNVKFFDIYFEEESKNTISLGIRLEFQSFKKTLLTEEIEQELTKLSELLINTYNCDLKN